MDAALALKGLTVWGQDVGEQVAPWWDGLRCLGAPSRGPSRAVDAGSQGAGREVQAEEAASATVGGEADVGGLFWWEVSQVRAGVGEHLASRVICASPPPPFPVPLPRNLTLAGCVDVSSPDVLGTRLPLASPSLFPSGCSSFCCHDRPCPSPKKQGRSHFRAGRGLREATSRNFLFCSRGGGGNWRPEASSLRRPRKPFFGGAAIPAPVLPLL